MNEVARRPRELGRSLVCLMATRDPVIWAVIWAVIRCILWVIRVISKNLERI